MTIGEAEEVLSFPDRYGVLTKVQANAILAKAWMQTKRKTNGPTTQQWARSVGFHECGEEDGTVLSIDGCRSSIVLYFGGTIAVPERCEIDDGNSSAAFQGKDRASVRDMAKALGIELKGEG